MQRAERQVEEDLFAITEGKVHTKGEKISRGDIRCISGEKTQWGAERKAERRKDGIKVGDAVDAGGSRLMKRKEEKKQGEKKHKNCISKSSDNGIASRGAQEEVIALSTRNPSWGGERSDGRSRRSHPLNSQRKARRHWEGTDTHSFVALVSRE